MKKAAKTSKGVTTAQLRRIALSFPEASEKTSYGKPAYSVGKKFFTRLRTEDDSLVFIVDGMDQRDMMLELDPATYHITAHYKDYPAVLVRMERITLEELQTMLERRWRKIAPKKLLKEMEAEPAQKPATRQPSRKR